MSARHTLAALLLAFSYPILSAAVAEAAGTVRVQQTNGTVQLYHDVSIRVTHRVLRITTSDGKGTLIIDQAACSYVGDIQKCLPTSVKLAQNGTTRPLTLKTGTVYVNTTGQNEQLAYSSEQIPPNGILLALQTQVGTYVSLDGTIDEITYNLDTSTLSLTS